MKESLKEPIINESKKKIKSHLYLEDNEHNENNFTLSLNFEKEDLKIPSEKNELNHVSQWNQV